MGILVTSPRPYPPPPSAVPWPGVAAMRWLVPDLVPEGDAPEAHALNLLDPKAHGLMLVQNGVRGLGMPRALREVGVGEAQFETVARMAMHDLWLRTNPRTIASPADVLEILSMAA